MNADEVRALFPIMKKRTYLFSGGIAPPTTRSLEAFQNHIDYLTYDADDLYFHAWDELGQVRRLFAQLMDADEDEVAVTDSTSAGSNIAIEVIEPNPGGNVVSDDFNYPSSIYPWMVPPRDKVELRFVRPRDHLIHLEDMEKAIDDSTIAVSVSHVTPLEGFRHDIGALAKMAHTHGALLLVDGAQSAGAMRLDLHELDVDFFSCCAMKWLLGAAGVGFFYVARRHLGRLPKRVGYAGTDGFDIHNFKLLPNARRFELGMPNMMGLAFTKPGLEILLEVGMEQVERHVLELSGHCIQGMRDRGMNMLTSLEPEYRLGVIAAELDNAKQLQEFLYLRGVDTFYFRNIFRVDPHIFNNLADIDRFLEGVDAYNAQR